MTEARYKTIAEELAASIRNGTLQPGEVLPTEAGLMSRYDVSRYTIREALKVLKRENLVASRRGSGWTVTEPEALQPKEKRVVSFSSYMPDSVATYQTMEGMRRVFSPHNVEVTFRKYHLVYTKEGLEHLRTEGNPDALAFFSNHGVREENLTILADWPIPVVNVGYCGYMPFDTISCDYRRSARLLVEQAIRDGHKGILFLGPKEFHRTIPAMIERQRGYEETMRIHGLEPYSILHDQNNLSHEPNIATIFPEWLAEAESEWQRPTCIIGSVHGAVATIAALTANDTRWGDLDVSCFGLPEPGDLPGGAKAVYVAPENWEEVGEIAGARILSRLNGGIEPASLSLVKPQLLNARDLVPEL